MIYEIRTYRVKVGSLPEVEKRFGEGYEHRKKISPLAAFWHTEIGPLNEIIHVWRYKNIRPSATASGRTRSKAGNWPPKIAEFIADHAVGDRDAVPVPARPQAGQDGADLRDALLHDQGGHAART